MPIAFDSVVYRYPCSSKPALDGLTFAFPQRQRCAIVGRNGCGKTTLLHLADGLLRPQQGRVLWQGVPLRYQAKSLGRLRQNVGLAFQNPEHQLVATTVEEDLSYGLCNLQLPTAEIARRVGEALVAFDLESLADTPINALSLGQKKRVAIADVMVLQPQLLLLDEPTAYLDPTEVRRLARQLDAIAAAGTTVAIATHDLDFAYAWADWVAVMDGGRVVLEGPTEVAFARRDCLEPLGLGLPLAVDLAARSAIAGTEAIALRAWLRRRLVGELPDSMLDRGTYS